MPEDATKTTLYRLIEAGHLARQRLLMPLHARGLETGDDAILFSIDSSDGVSEADLRQQTGLNEIALEMRLVRLQDSGVIARTPGARPSTSLVYLTDKGRDTANVLHAHWQELETALTAELPEKDRKRLRKMLKRFTTVLRL